MALIVTFGELLAEFVCIDDKGRPAPMTPRPGRFAGPFPSGAPAIFVNQAARMGVDTRILGAVGDDPFGLAILERLESDGTDVSLLTRHRTLPTGTAHVGYNPDGSRDFVFHITASAAGAVDASAVAPLLAGANVVHISGATLADATLRAIALDVVRAVKRTSIKISFDPNVRPELLTSELRAAAITCASAADWMTPSSEDLEALFPGADALQSAGRWAEGGCIVAVTRGDAGAVLVHPGGQQAVAGHSVCAIDPTGAGDAFAATFAAAMMRGQSPEASMQLANAAGALATTKLGPMEGNSWLADVERLARPS
ncbi:MAG: sugar kinase [Pseudomonadota bacterium]